MSGYLLDTNIVSNLVRPVPSAPLLDWIAAQEDATLFIAAVTLGEIRRGILQMPVVQKRTRLDDWFSGNKGPAATFADRICPFDQEAALIWAVLMAEGRAIGRPRDAIDMMIAAIAQVRGFVIVTDNERDFAGLGFINPLRQGTEAP
ncbi:type II toxin-antitoxin system VapC family toxin [Methylorubrum sp. SB2]|uniref:type II toxin-antitoxin system VapC family toxin n=1 Tax=Methylorubrum subtropicum TaxID=3138812 RepID=UPI00313CF53B